MDWIKRNLYFLVGALVAVALMAWAGFYLFSKLNLNNEKMTQLNEQYSKLDQLNRQNPHPGTPKTDNVKAAREQQQELTKVVEKIRSLYKPIPRIPDVEKVNSQEFTAALRRTIDQLQKQATNSSVAIPNNYSFSFEAQKPRVTFAVGSLEPLSVQLGEVSAICDVLFAAKINALDNIRRERVSPDDSSGPPADYHERKSVTNEMAVIATYDLSFRSFSGELAAVLAGFASSPHGMVVKTINVDPAPATQQLIDPYAAVAAPTPYYVPTPMPSPGMESEAAMMARRYGAVGGGGGGEASMAARYGVDAGPGGSSLGGVPLRTPGTPAPGYAPAPAYNPYTSGAVPQPAPGGRGGLPTVLDERLLKVSLSLDIIKLLPPPKTEN